MTADNLKTAVIAVLCILVAAQAAWIVHLSPMPEIPPTPSVKEARTAPDRSGVEVELTAPVDTDAVPAAKAATLKPQTGGEWEWSNPYLLRFRADSPLAQDAEYTLKMAPSLNLDGETEFTLRTGTFRVEEIRMREQAGPRPGTAIISTFVRFTAPVSPEELLKNATLTDSDGEALPLQVTTSWSSRRMELRSDPVEKTPDGATYSLTLKSGLKRSGSELALDRDSQAEIELKLNPVLTFRGADPFASGGETGIRLTFSTPMDARKAAGHVSVSPKADFNLRADGDRLILQGGFTPGERYDVSLQQGLTAADGAELAEGATVSVTVPDLPPSVGFVGQGLFLPDSRRAGLALDAVNTDEITVRVDRVYPNNLFSMLREYGWRIFDNDWNHSGVPYSLGGKVMERSVPVGAKRNESVRLPPQFGDTFAEGERGLFKVSASIKGQNGAKRWMIVSDIGLMAKRGKDRFLVWAVSNTTLEPLSGIRLTLVSDKNQQLARTRTDRAGTASLPLPAGDEEGRPYLILAERTGGDFTFLLPSRFEVDTTGLDVSGSQSVPSGLRAYLYGERDLYRPGETLKGLAVVRKDDLTVPPEMPLVLVQHDPRGREIRKVRLTTDQHGSAAFEIPLPDYALTGRHSLTLRAGDRGIGTLDFKVEEFVPDRIKVEVKTAHDTFRPGQTIKAEVRSSYLFGPPASKLPVTARVRLESAPFTAPGYSDYVFGNPDQPFEPQEVFSRNTVLDEDGHAEFEIPVPDGLTPPSALTATIFGRVSESGGRGVTARKRVTIHPYESYIGIRKLNKNGYEYGQPITFDFISTDPSGTPAEHGELRAAFYRDRWRTVVRKSPSGGYRYESVNDPELISETVIQAGKAEGSVDFTPPSYGSYRAFISSPRTGASAQAEFFCGGWGYSPWALENPARIELVTDREQYDPGDTATVQVRAPFPGRLLVTVEGDEVHHSQTVQLDGNTGEVTLPVKAHYAPNAYVTAMLIRRAGDVPEGSVGRAFGVTPLLVDNLSNRMEINVDAPAEVRPGTEMTMTVKTQPGAVVTLAAVDEGIMQLSGSDDPDPFDFFYARRALGVRSYDTFALLYPDLARIMGRADAGGGMAMMAESRFMRTEGIRRVKPVSFWSGPLTADAEGTVRYTAKLPDFQGALRIMAVGLDGKRFGAASHMTRVRAPIALTPTLPRFMAPGDSVRMPVTVRNDLGSEAGITVRVKAQGALSSNAKGMTLQLADEAEQTVHLPLTAASGAGGKGTVTITAEGGGESRSVTVELPVRPALPYRREAAFGSIKGSGDLVPAAQGFVPGTVTREVSVGTMPLTRFAGKLRNLLRYPYGCAEQTASRAFPLIRFGDLARAMAPDAVDEKGPAFMVQSAIMRLLSMQSGDGGFAFWPGGTRSHPWVSAYVTHFLLEAKQAGFTSPGMLQRALGHMRTLGAQRGSDFSATSYALFNLAKAGSPDRGSMDELRDNRKDRLSAADRTLLACAYALSGDMESYNALLAELPQMKAGRASGGGMGSELRDSALMLLTLADAAPDDRLVPQLTENVSRLMAANPWGTTQENALAFAAVGKALNLGDAAPLSGALVQAGTDHPFKNAETFARTFDGGGALELRLESPEATAFWSATTRGIPQKAEVASNGLNVRRTFLDRQGRPVDVATVEQGTLLIMKTEVRAETDVENVVVQALLPAGMEVENPRLESSETATFSGKKERPLGGHQDLRDDRILFFTDLNGGVWHAGYSQLRAITPGSFALPPVQAEAMYDPSIFALGPKTDDGAVGRTDVTVKE